MEKKWFLAIDGKQVGPVADMAIEKLLENGRINADTLVWGPEMETWAKLGTVDALKGYLKVSAAPPPPLPPVMPPPVSAASTSTTSAPTPIQAIAGAIEKSGLDKQQIMKWKQDASSAGTKVFNKMKKGGSGSYVKYAGYAAVVIIGFWLVSSVFKGCSGSESSGGSGGGGIFESKEVKQVKGGTLGADKTVTVGNALDKYKHFSKTKWKSFKDEQDRQVVEFTGIYSPDEIKKECNDAIQYAKNNIINSVKGEQEWVEKAQNRLSLCEEALAGMDGFQSCYYFTPGEIWGNDAEEGWMDGISPSGTNCDYLEELICNCVGTNYYCLPPGELDKFSSERISEQLRADIDYSRKEVQEFQARIKNKKAVKLPHCSKDGKIVVQFLIHPNDDEFEIGYQGQRKTCDKGKIDDVQYDFLIDKIYKNEEITGWYCY